MDSSWGSIGLARHAVVERRAFLRGAVAAALGAGPAMGLLASCTSGDGSASSSSVGGGTTAVPTTGPPPFDPALPYWMQGGFAPVRDEAEVMGLSVTGSLPPELSGLYVRNGPNPGPGVISPHWFLGDGMVHGVRLSGGNAEWYRARYVQTPLVGSDGTREASAPPGGASNRSNVSVFHHAGRLLSSGEVGFPYELSLEDLSTVGVYDYDGRLSTFMTAHPKVDPATGKLHFFGYGFAPPYLTYHVVSADGTLERSEEVELSAPVMIHDFAVTDRDVIFWDLPVLFDLDLAVRMTQGETVFPYRWDESHLARVGVMPLDGPASAIRWVEVSPRYVFHGVNAYRSGDDVVLEVCQQDAAFRGDDLEASRPHRWTIGTGGEALTFADERLTDDEMDLPSIDRRFTGRAHEQAWYLGTGPLGDFEVEFDSLRRLDGRTGAFDVYAPGPGERLNEGFFVPAGPDAGEGEGWLLSYAWDRARDATDLLVLDALDLAAGPVARVHLPVRVPYGFHGVWVGEEDLA